MSDYNYEQIKKIILKLEQRYILILSLEFSGLT